MQQANSLNPNKGKGLMVFFIARKLALPVMLRSISSVLKSFVFFSLLLGWHNIMAQESTPVDTTNSYKVMLMDGSELIGKILEQDSSQIVMQTSVIPRLAIPRDKITKIEALSASNYKKGEYWFENPHATRYLIGPSAFNLKKGEGYYQNTWIFLNSFNVGLTNHISLGGGLEFISTFSGLTNGKFDPIFYLTPKASFQVSERFHAGGGILYLHAPDNSNGGIGYGMATYGNTDNNITAGIGWFFSSFEFENRPVITISGMKRISRKLGLVSENWILPANDYMGLYSYGIRFFGEKMAVDLAFINNRDIFDFLFIGIPYVDFVVKF